MVEKSHRSTSKEENSSVAEARARFQNMLEKRNLDDMSPNLAKKRERYLIRIASSPEDSVFRLMPSEIQPRRDIALKLFRMGIRTKNQLINLSESRIKGGLKTKNWKVGMGLRSKSIPIVLAMRDLARAEARERSSGIS